MPNNLTRYSSLIKKIRNWPLYWSRKFKDGYESLEFITRNNRLRFRTPYKSLYLVFKEIFVDDVYRIDTLVKQLPQQPVVIDIGGNAGYFNLLLFNYLPNARSIAYEPIEANYKLFKYHIDANPALKGKLAVNHAAVVGQEQESVELFVETSASNSVTASIYEDFDRDNTFHVTVKAITLDQILRQNQLSHVDLLKVDCEGSEYPIIYESPEYVWQIVKKIIIEVHNLDEHQRNVESLQKYLETRGYTCSRNTLHNHCYMLFACKN